MKLERKTIFLYPKTCESNNDLYEATSQLITRIQKVVKISNHLIEDILCSGCFSSVKCKPKVDMECVGKNVEDFSDYSNVRICIAKYDDLDYTSNYTKIVDDVKKDKTDISHLVALHIYSSSRSINFYKDQENHFDAIVETDLDHLEHLLTAIMLDISLYHYFSLSTDLIFRKKFNNIKFEYISKKYNKESVKKIYGEKLEMDKTIYLPFSLNRVFELNRRTKKITKNKTIRTLIKDYGIFLIESISIKLEVDKHGYISNNIDKEEYYQYLENFVKKNRIENIAIADKTILIIPFNDLTKNDTPVMLEYKSEETDITKWLDLLKNDIGKYTIILIKKEA